MAQLAEDAALREKIAAANRSKIQEEYSFETMRDLYLERYLEALEGFKKG